MREWSDVHSEEKRYRNFAFYCALSQFIKTLKMRPLTICIVVFFKKRRVLIKITVASVVWLDIAFLDYTRVHVFSSWMKHVLRLYAWINESEEKRNREKYLFWMLTRMVQLRKETNALKIACFFLFFFFCRGWRRKAREREKKENWQSSRSKSLFWNWILFVVPF